MPYTYHDLVIVVHNFCSLRLSMPRDIPQSPMDEARQREQGSFAGNVFSACQQLGAVQAVGMEEKEEKEESEEAFICTDEYPPMFHTDGKNKVRQVHSSGCVVGHDVLLMTDENIDNSPWFAAKIIGRSVDKDKVVVHIRGNSTNNIDGGHQLAWKVAGGYYFREKPRKVTDEPLTTEVWIASILTWSCDWHLGKQTFKVPAAAKGQKSKYYRYRRKSKNVSRISIIVDGMDQIKMQLPIPEHTTAATK